MIPIRWQSTELPNFETHPLTPGLFLASATYTVIVPAKTSSAVPTAGMPLPTGAIAGIVIGAVACVVLIVVAALLIMRKKRRRTFVEAQRATAPGTSGMPWNGPELGGHGILRASSAEATPGTAIHEATSGQPNALHAAPTYPELPGGRHQASSQTTRLAASPRLLAATAPPSGQQSWHAPSSSGAQGRMAELAATTVTSDDDYYDGDGDELARLRRRRERIAERRQRLVELQRLDEEENLLHRRIHELEGEAVRNEADY